MLSEFFVGGEAMVENRTGSLWNLFSMQKYAYYLRGVQFDIETDHNILRWIEASQVPMIIRWRVYLQSFDFLIVHIAGTRNVVADVLSKLLKFSTYLG